jgi:radical SAM/Cys-rich protein
MFENYMTNNGIDTKRRALEILQLNIGKKCNQSCKHCHVEAGPLREEEMTKATMDQILTLLKQTPSIRRVELTGGAPELNSNFRYLVEQLKKLNRQIALRSNLTVFFEAGQSDTPSFLKDNEVEIIGSLPCYTEDNVDKQRGTGVFNKSITALKLLNELGYGLTDKLKLNLVYNPQGLGLPGKQEELERDYKSVLLKDYGIFFNSLFTITNMAIGNFSRELETNNQLDAYKDLLINSFNPTAGNNIMCKSLLSIDYQGNIYDCDFNQMLEIPKHPLNVSDFDSFSNFINEIIFEDHCFACTAGFGSSCNGALI